MWTSDNAALAAADRHLCTLLGLPALRTQDRLYTRQPRPECWSNGLAKRLFDVAYSGWQSPRLFRLRWNPQSNAETAWQEFPATEPPIDWRALPQAAPLAEPALRQRIVQQVQTHFPQPVQVFDLLRYGSPRRPTLFDGEVWSASPREQILIRLNADTGDLMGWRHAGWFADGADNPPAAPDIESLRRAVESLPFFPPPPAVLQRADAWPSTDRPGHVEMLWQRFEDGEEVENDTLYANVNLASGQVAECLLNWSPLSRDLPLERAAALDALDSAFDQRFPDVTRCGQVRRMFMEIPGQTVKPRAWVANAVGQSGPVQIALDSQGAVLRADAT